MLIQQEIAKGIPRLLVTFILLYIACKGIEHCWPDKTNQKGDIKVLLVLLFYDLIRVGKFHCK